MHVGYKKPTIISQPSLKKLGWPKMWYGNGRTGGLDVEIPLELPASTTSCQPCSETVRGLLRHLVGIVRWRPE